MIQKVLSFIARFWPHQRQAEPIEMILNGKPIYESDHRALGIRRRLEKHTPLVGKR